MKHLLLSRTTWRGLLAKHLKVIVQLRSRCVKEAKLFLFYPVSREFYRYQKENNKPYFVTI